MKIVIANRRYFESSGPEKYLFSIKKMLEAHDYEVYPFSVKRKDNYECETSKYSVRRQVKMSFFTRIIK